jgi:hypothetical protein
VQTNGQVALAALAAGNHTVGLSLVASNCHLQGDNPRVVAVAAGETATETFEVVCSS